MSGYLGVDNTARKVKELYVGVGNTARVVQKAYIGVGNVARLWYTRGTQLGDLAVGSSVYFKVNNVRTEWLVVQQGNPDASIYDSSCDGTWLLMKNIYEKRRWGNNSYANSYADGGISTYLNNTIFNLFEAGIKNVIKQVKIPYRPGSGNSSSVYMGSNGLSVKVFLLSAIEVGFTTNTTPPQFPASEGVKLSYFETTANASNSKRIANFNNSATKWWLRSPLLISRFIVFVDTDGSQDGNSANYQYGIRPCLILPKTALTDDNNNVIGG